MEASQTAAPPAPPADDPGAAVPPAGGDGGQETAGSQQPPPPPPQEPEPAPQEAQTGEKTREYTVLEEITLDLSTKAAQKDAAEELAKRIVSEAQQGKLTVHVRIGGAVAEDPRKAIKNLGQVRELDGDYEVVANSTITKFPKVKTSTEVNVSIG